MNYQILLRQGREQGYDHSGITRHGWVDSLGCWLGECRAGDTAHTCGHSSGARGMHQSPRCRTTACWVASWMSSRPKL